jgi:hypothetical protein
VVRCDDGRVYAVLRTSQWTPSARSLGNLGLAGSCAIAVSSFWVAAVPLYFRQGNTPIVSLLPIGSFLPRAVFYLGLATIVWAWLRLGRLIVQPDPGADFRAVRRIALKWAAPLVFAIPLGSRDLWAYAAQSQLMRHHLDPYSLGPSALPGAFSIEVSHRWIDTPAPYGPLWLLTGRVIANVIGLHVGLTVAVLRLLAVIGLLLLAWALPHLAARAGGRPDVAIWLVLANPLTLVLGLGGGHNDLLMIGLMTAGLVVVTSPGSMARTLIAGSAVLTAAVAIKSPSAVALAFAVPLWSAYAPSGRRWRQAHGVGPIAAMVGAVSISVFTAITLISGLGLGWVKQVNSSASVVSWMSLPTFAAILWDLVTGRLHRILKLDAEMTHFRTAGTALSVLLLVAFWLAAVGWVNGYPSRLRAPNWFTRTDPWTLLAAALTTVVLLAGHRGNIIAAGVGADDHRRSVHRHGDHDPPERCRPADEPRGRGDTGRIPVGRALDGPAEARSIGAGSRPDNRRRWAPAGGWDRMRW